MALRVEVVSPAGEAWAGEATQVSVPLINVRLSPVDGEMRRVEVSGGFCSVDHDVITIAADHVKQDAEA